MAMIHVNRSGQSLGIFDEARVREGLATGEFIGTDLGWMEGMPAWRPLSELENFGAAAAPPPPETPPPPMTAGTAPAAAPLVTAADVQPIGDGTGLPWEHRDQHGLVNALLKTIAMVLTRPNDAFGVMKRDAGLLDPLLYAVIIGTIAAVISFIYSMLLQSVGVFSSGDGGVGRLMGAGALSGLSVVFAPVWIAIFIFIAAGLVHLGLMLVGGANRSFETTVRVFCYSSGSANVLQLVPGCGGLLAGLTSIVLNCIGLARAHQTDTWRAVVAVLLPIVLCCGLGSMFMFLVFGAMAADWR